VEIYLQFERQNGSLRYGGFSSSLFVEQQFAVHVPVRLFKPEGAPIVGAGTSVYSAIKEFGGKLVGEIIGVVGSGGVASLAVQYAKAMGATVMVIYKEENEKLCGADRYVSIEDPETLKALSGSLRMILDTAGIDVNRYMGLLKANGVMCCMGIPVEGTTYGIEPFPVIFGRKTLAGSFLGSIEEMKEALKYADSHHIQVEMEVISASQVNDAFKMMRAGGPCRYVLDSSTISEFCMRSNM